MTEEQRYVDGDPAKQAWDLLAGTDRIESVEQALDYLKTFAEVLEGEISPAGWAEQLVGAIGHLIEALETEERGCEMRGWCYAVVYGALDLGTPPEPPFQGSLQGPEQDELDRDKWRDGIAAGQQALGNGIDGVALRNRVLLRVAHTDEGSTVTSLWQAACASTGDTQLAAAYPVLDWPFPTGA